MRSGAARLFGLQARRGGAAAFTPADLFASGEAGGYGDINPDTTGVAVDSAIAQANDESGNTNHLAQGTGSLQPLLKGVAGDYNALFDGTDDFIGVSFGTPLAQPFTVGLAVNIKTLPASSLDVLFDATSNNTNRSFLAVEATPKLQVFSGSTVDVQSYTPVEDTGFAIIIQADGASTTVHIDGVSKSLSGNPGTQGLNGLRLAANVSGNIPVNAAYAAWFVREGGLTEAERANLESWLAGTQGRTL